MKSQNQRILTHLQDRAGQWVAMPELYSVSGSMAVATRISNLREQGHDIENTQHTIKGVRHSFYRIKKGDAA